MLVAVSGLIFMGQKEWYRKIFVFKDPVSLSQEAGSVFLVIFLLILGGQYYAYTGQSI